jgi:hypothetical protein
MVNLQYTAAMRARHDAANVHRFSNIHGVSSWRIDSTVDARRVRAW